MCKHYETLYSPRNNTKDAGRCKLIKNECMHYSSALHHNGCKVPKECPFYNAQLVSDEGGMGFSTKSCKGCKYE